MRGFYNRMNFAIGRLYLMSMLCLSMVLFPVFGKTQSPEEIAALNHYVDFLNESIHGLFTAHALMVISNKEVNKFIDLDSYSLNKLSNNEVQSNLFDKSDKENYTTFQSYSPLQLLKISKENSSALNPRLASSLNSKADKIGQILNRVNSLRFEIFNFIDNNDLDDQQSIYKVYEMLEECASLFEGFAIQQKEMLAEINKEAAKNKNALYQKALDLHRINKSILNDLRYENKNGVLSKTKNYIRTYDNFHTELQSYSNYNKAEYKSYIQNRSDSIYQHLVRFETSNYIPRAYEIYGAYYFYHNQIAKRFLNWSGPGYVRYLNSLLESTGIDFIKFSEQALIFKVVYPMKLDELNSLEKTESFVASAKLLIESNLSTAVIEEKPERKNYLTIELSDYNMIDKDTISLLLNGEYILEKYCLGAEVKELKIPMTGEDRFILELVAENNGVIAPNTPLLAYRFDGERKKRRIKHFLNKGDVYKFTLEIP